MTELEFDKALDLAEQKISRAKADSNNRLWSEALVRGAQTHLKKSSAANAYEWLKTQEIPGLEQERFYVRLYLLRLSAEAAFNHPLAQELWRGRQQWGALNAEQTSFYQEGTYPPRIQKSLLEAMYLLWTDKLFEELKPQLKSDAIQLSDFLASPSVVAEQEGDAKKLARIHHEAVFSLHQMGLTDAAIELERLWVKRLSTHFAESAELKSLAEYLIEKTGHYITSPWWASAQALTAKLILEGSSSADDLIKVESIAQTASRKFPNAPGGRESAELLGGMNQPELGIKYDSQAQSLVVKSRGLKSYELKKQMLLPKSLDQATGLFEVLAGEESKELSFGQEPEAISFEPLEFREQGQSLHSIPLMDLKGLSKITINAKPVNEESQLSESLIVNPNSASGYVVRQSESEGLLHFVQPNAKFEKIFVQETSGLVSEVAVKNSQAIIPCDFGQSIKLILVSKSEASAQRLDCPLLRQGSAPKEEPLKIELPQWSQKSEGLQAKLTKVEDSAQWPLRWQVDRLSETSKALSQFEDLSSIPSQAEPILTGTVNESEGAERQELMIDLSGLSEGLYRLSLLEPNPQSQVFLIAEDSPGLKLPLLIAQGKMSEGEQSLFLYLGAAIKWAFLDIFQSGKLSQRIRIETSKRLSLEVPEGALMAYRLWSQTEGNELISTQFVPAGSPISSMLATKALTVRRPQAQRGLTFEPGRLTTISQ